jgi:hypothetical protein
MPALRDGHSLNGWTMAGIMQDAGLTLEAFKALF